MRHIILACVFLFSLSAQATLFRNAYVQFELPERWNCHLEGTEWVCSSQDKAASRESIIILTAKEAGPQDTYEAYQKYLKTPRTASLLNGKSLTSQVKNVSQRKINEQQWVDALHLGSEIPGYYTRYLATIKDRLAILVTLSAHQRSYTKYATDFYRAVESLRVVASKDILAPHALAPLKPGTEALGPGMNTALPGLTETGPPPGPSESSMTTADWATLIALLLLLGAIAYYIIKRKKK